MSTSTQSTQLPIINEIVDGHGLTMGQAAKIVPAHRGEGRTNPATVWRWCTQGHKMPDGSFLKLECAKLAGRWLTTKSAIARFLTAITAASSPEATNATTQTKPTRWQSTRMKASEAAGRKLSEKGA
jgi:hypothetical protein